MGWLDTIGKVFGGSGGSSGSSGIWGDLFKGVLSGLGASAAAKADSKDAKEQLQLAGQQQRASTAYEAELADFYRRRKDYEDYRGLDNYGQFSRASIFAPGYKPTSVPTDPGQPPQPKA